MNVFLQELSAVLGERMGLIILDGAGWHKSKKLEIPANVEILYLPPYSPELNPVERLWAYLKRYTIKNQIYDSLEQLEDAVVSFLTQMTSAQFRSICSSPHLFI